MGVALARAAGAGVSAIIGGKRFLIHPLCLRDYGIVENEILKSRVNPVEAARLAIQANQGSFDDQQADYLLTKAYRDAATRNKATDEEILSWIDSRSGLSFTLWLAIRKDQVIDCEWLESEISNLNKDRALELARYRDIASGVNEFVNYDWPDSRPKKTETFMGWFERRNAEKVESYQSWRYIYRELAEVYQWADPQTVGNLTYYQARMIMCDKKALGGVQKMSPEEAAKQGIQM